MCALRRKPHPGSRFANNKQRPAVIQTKTKAIKERRIESQPANKGK
jgi:hypothetical protein